MTEIEVLQSVDYTYNVRGWLTRINDPSEVQLDGDFFGEELFYDNQDESLSNIGNSRLFNGNISAVKWQSIRPTGIEGPTATGLKAYVYDYDNLNRLKSGSFLEAGENSWINNSKYSEIIDSYDLNGNIGQLNRHGVCVLNNSPATIDSLTYTYYGNQLIAVDDAIPINNTDDFYDNGHYYNRNQEPEYKYDGNGNVMKDLNKNIIDITYNYQNLPVSINKRGENRVEYDYDAVGNKLCQRYILDGSLIKTTDFVSNFVYEDGIPAWVIHDEGRVVFDQKDGAFAEAFLKDHLGNVRVAVRRSSGQTTIRQIDSYYPFGKTIRDLSRNGRDDFHANEYLYNGKMHQDELGLNWLDYGARFYDPVLGRWHSVDPLAEKYRRWSPYNYCVDNPMRFIDPDGMEFDEASRRLAHRTIRKTENKANRLERRATNTSNKDKKIDLVARASELRKSANEVRSMDANKEYIFNIDKTPVTKPFTGPTTDMKHIKIQYTGKTASLLHEMKHGNQFMIGEMSSSYNTETKLWSLSNYGVNDEIAAYKAQYAFDGKLSLPEFNPNISIITELAIRNGQKIPTGEMTVTNMNQINSSLIDKIGEGWGLERGTQLYPVEMPNWYQN